MPFPDFCKLHIVKIPQILHRNRSLLGPKCVCQKSDKWFTENGGNSFQCPGFLNLLFKLTVFDWDVICANWKHFLKIHKSMTHVSGRPATLRYHCTYVNVKKRKVRTIFHDLPPDSLPKPGPQHWQWVVHSFPCWKPHCLWMGLLLMYVSLPRLLAA